MKAIVVCTIPGRERWLRDCVDSIKAAGLDCVIHVGSVGTGYELATIDWARRLYNEFILLQDSVIVKDAKAFNDAFADEGRMYCFAEKGYGYYCKFVSSLLPEELPVAKSKMDSIRYETEWMRPLIAKHDAVMYDPVLIDCDRYDSIHGTRVMVIENPWFIKYKSCWHPSMVKQ